MLAGNIDDVSQCLICSYIHPTITAVPGTPPRFITVFEVSHFSEFILIHDYRVTSFGRDYFYARRHSELTIRTVEVGMSDGFYDGAMDGAQWWRND